MGRVLWIVVVLAMLWCGWWWIAATALSEGSKRWLADQPAGGWQLDMAAASVRGFPFALRTRVEQPRLADPVAGVAVSAEGLDMQMPAYWPGDVVLDLPETPVSIVLPGAEMQLQATDAWLALNLHPGLALEVEALRAESGPWEIRGPQGVLAGADAVDAALVQDEDRPALYHLTLTAADLTPGAALRDALALGKEWPQALEELTLDMGLAFAAPLDRKAVQNSLPPPRQVALRRLKIAWGPVSLTAEGDIAFDSGGIPKGRLNAKVTQWRQIMAQAALAGLISPPERARAELVLNALANMGGSAETLELELRFAQGQMFLGPIALGPAPRLVLP